MNKIVFGSDFDDCIVHTAVEILKELGCNYANILKSINRFSISECLNVPKHYVDVAIDKVLERTDLKLYNSFIRVVDNLLTKVGHMYVITSRRNHIEAANQILESIMVPDDEYTLCKCDRYETGIPNKSDVIVDIGVNVFVEDRFATAVDIINNTNSYVLLMDKPWNRRLTKLDRLVRVNDWYDVLEFINKIQ